jgi:hypothetical protein
MGWAALTTATAGAILLSLAFRLGRSMPRRPVQRFLLSPVTQQHLHLFQGGRLSEAAVETAKARFRGLLDRGRVADAEACLRPGLQFAIQVQALAELGSPYAGTIFRRQLQRRLSDDAVEQSWYWIDLAHGIRHLGRADCLPQLLRCPATIGDVPLGQYYAAETACCPGFADVFRRPLSPLGRSALRVLHSALRGLRHGVPPQTIGEGRLGEVVARMWRHRPERSDPLVVRVLIESLRLLQRSDHTEFALAGNPYGGETLRRQLGELLTLEDAFIDYLLDAPTGFCEALASAGDDERPDLLAALADLRADASAVVLPLIHCWPASHRPLGVHLLAFGRGPEVPAALIGWVRQWVNPERRARHMPRHAPPPRPSVPDALPYTDILSALRRHPTTDVEELLCSASQDWDPTIRVAAVGGLGWWEPFDRSFVLRRLVACRDDNNTDVRIGAEAALARLGNQRSLQFFRHSLVGESDTPVPKAIRRVATEGLSWLWPELDSLADADDLEIAQNAREAIEQLREEIAGGPWIR